MTPIFAAGQWWLVALHLPFLLITVSLVYSATRHDRWDLILKDAVGWGARMALFLLGLGVLLFVLSSYPDWWWLILFPVVVGMIVYYAWNSPWFRRQRDQEAKAAEKPAATSTVAAKPETAAVVPPVQVKK